MIRDELLAEEASLRAESKVLDAESQALRAEMEAMPKRDVSDLPPDLRSESAILQDVETWRGLVAQRRRLLDLMRQCLVEMREEIAAN